MRWLQRHAGPGSRFLGIGSGAGDLVSEYLGRFPGAKARAVELSTTGIRIVEKRAPQAQFLQCDLLETTKSPDAWAQWADIAVYSEVLEHVDEPEIFLSHAKGFPSPECRVFVTVPGGPASVFDRCTGHRRHYTRGDLIELLE